MGWSEVVSSLQTQQNPLNNLVEEGLLKTDWTNVVVENILIYGESGTGKTYIALQKAKEILEKDPKARLFYFSTDMGYRKVVQQPEFEILRREAYNPQTGEGRVFVFEPKTIKEAIKAKEAIKPILQPNDLVVFDLVDWIWDAAQYDFLLKMTNGNPELMVEYIESAAQDKKKFGLFEGNMWTYIKTLADRVNELLIRNPICSVIAIAREKEPFALQQIDNVWQKFNMPGGQKELRYEFNTVVKVKYVSGKRYFIVVKSRDREIDEKEYEYSENFWELFEKWRRKEL